MQKWHYNLSAQVCEFSLGSAVLDPPPFGLTGLIVSRLKGAYHTFRLKSRENGVSQVARMSEVIFFRFFYPLPGSPRKIPLLWPSSGRCSALRYFHHVRPVSINLACYQARLTTSGRKFRPKLTAVPDYRNSGMFFLVNEEQGKRLRSMACAMLSGCLKGPRYGQLRGNALVERRQAKPYPTRPSKVSNIVSFNPARQIKRAVKVYYY